MNRGRRTAAGLSPGPRFAALVLVVLSLTAQAQSTYRWVDPSGAVHYSDQPPPPEAKSVEQKRLGTGNVVEGGLDYATRQAAEKYPVTLYTNGDCGDPCALARDLLRRRKIPHGEKQIRNADDLAAFKKATGLVEGFAPALAVGSGTANGFVEAEWNALLDAAGYPR